MIASLLKKGRISSTSYHSSEVLPEEEWRCIDAAKKDIRNFEPLYKKYYPEVVSFVYRRVPDKATAFEITSDVFYTALEKIGNYEYRGLPFGSWLFRIAINRINALYRKNKIQRSISIDETAIPSLGTELIQEESINDQELFTALQSLEEEELNLIELRFFEKRAFQEISEIMGLNEGACKMRLYRVLEKIKRELKKN
jgi:RNA polymerase sigma-70 factor, ECF subfamily